MTTINTITVTYKDEESTDFANYAIGQGNVINYHTDIAAKTITFNRADQEDDDQLEEFDDMLQFVEDPDTADPDGELGIVSFVGA